MKERWEKIIAASEVWCYLFSTPKCK